MAARPYVGSSLDPKGVTTLSGPLTGYKVLEMANFISGPYAAMLLADLGAEVIKIELPGTGDPFRSWGERQSEERPQFAAYNRGKKSVTINAQFESGREVYRRLAQKMDVVVENFRPGTLDRMGLGYEALRETNPKLVYCAMSGMGSSGPYRNRPTYDSIAQAYSGLLSVLTDMKNPKPIGPAMSDQLTGAYAAYGIVAALLTRETRGHGQKIEISMLAANMAFMTEPVAEYMHDGEVSDQDSRSHRSQSYAFVASDGLPLAVHLSTPPKFWQGLATGVGRPELIEDPRFKTKNDRVKNYHLLRDLLAEAIRTRPRAEWLSILEQLDVPVAPINNIAETLDDPQVKHIGMLQTFGEGERAKKLVGFPISFAETACEPGLPPPGLGEHNDEIFAALGFTEAELAAMREEGAV